MGIKAFYLTKGKIRVRQGLKVEIGEIRVIAPSDFFYFCFPTNVF